MHFLHIMKKLVAFILLLLPVLLQAQQPATQTEDPAAKTVGNLLYVFDVPVCGKDSITPDPTGKFKYNTGCGDHLFWQVVELRQKAVPYLIALIESQEPTQAKLPSGKGYYRLGDVALMALVEIIHELPVEELAGVKYGSYSDRWKFYHKGLKDKKKRAALKEAIDKWYKDNRGKLVFEKSDTYGNCNCVGKHPIGGYFMLRKTDVNKEAPRKNE